MARRNRMLLRLNEGPDALCAAVADVDADRPLADLTAASRADDVALPVIRRVDFD